MTNDTDRIKKIMQENPAARDNSEILVREYYRIYTQANLTAKQSDEMAKAPTPDVIKRIARRLTQNDNRKAYKPADSTSEGGTI